LAALKAAPETIEQRSIAALCRGNAARALRGRQRRGGAMTNRQRLSNRRGSITFDIEALGLTFTVTASRFDNGKLGEVFIQNHKTNSAAGILASDAAIAASLALQFGCPAEVLARALQRDAAGNPTGPLGIAVDLLTRRP